MAVSAAPFALKNLAAGLDAEQLRQAVASLVPNGSGGIVQLGDLAVSAQAPAALGVTVGVGRAWLPGNNIANLAGQSYSTQGMYFALNDAPFPVALDTANSTNPRIDLIYIGAVDSAYGGASDAVKIDKVTGQPSATPVAPALPKNSIALATVAVAANAASVTAANITSSNPPPGTMRHAEFTSGSISIPANTLYGPGAYTADAANSANGGFAVPDIADCISIQPGLYQISFRVTGGTAIPSGWLEIHSKDDNTVYYGNTIAGVGSGGSGGVSVNLFFPVATIIRPRIFLTAAWTMSATRARITKLA